MPGIYFTGLFAALAIGVVEVLLAFLNLLSMRTRNMRSIGMYYACMAGEYTTKKPSGWNRVGFVVFALVLAPLASWLSVASAAWSWLQWRANQTAVPEEMKRLQYRITHLPMTKEQMIAWQEEVSKVLGIAGPVRTREGGGDPLVLVLEHGEWYSELRAQPDKHMFSIYAHTPDYDGIFHSTYEYRFEGGELMARLLDDHSQHHNEKHWNVRDGVVLEGEIRRRAAEGIIDRGDSMVAHYRNEVAWQPSRVARVRFFVMTMHPSHFSHAMVKELIRGELQRVGTLAEDAAAEGRRAGFEIVETADGVEFHFGTGWTKQEKEAACGALEEMLKSHQTSFSELGAHKKSRRDLLKIVGEKEC